MNALRHWIVAGLLSCATGAAAEETAALRVRWSDPRTERSERLSLLPIDVALPHGMSRERAIASWTRAIAGSEQRWDALPPGTYQIVMRAASVVEDASVPVEVGEVILSPGDDRTLPIVLPSASGRDGDAASRPLEIVIADDAIDGENLRVSLWSNGVRSEPTRTARDVSRGVLLTMHASCAAGAIVMVESSNSIGTAVLGGTCHEPIRINMAARAGLVARISTSRNVESPRSGLLRFANCAGDASFEIPFAISDSRVRSGVPAGCGEATLRVAGFVPVRLSSAQWTSGESHDAGTVTLARGAAAAVRVRAGDDDTPLANVRVTAVRPGDLAAMRGDLDPKTIALGSAKSASSGWARLAGLPAGRVIFLLHAAGRKQPQVSEPYAIEAGEETVIDDLVVETPANVFVTVEVPAQLEGALELHSVELSATGHTHWPWRAPLRAKQGAPGAVIEDVPPGAWLVRANGRLKNGFALRLAETPVDVAPGVDRHVTLTLTDTLYHGRVTSGGKGVRGTINLRPAGNAAGGQSVVAKSGPDGEFQVLLPGGGDYRASISDAANQRTVTLDSTVTFDDPEDEVAIDLPTGRAIRGVVVDSAGSPVEGVSVSAARQTADPAATIGAPAAGDGRFVLDGVVPGRWELIAASKSARSEPLVVSVGEGDLDGVRLVVDPLQTIRIRVSDSTGAPLRLVNINTEFLAPGSLTPQFYGRLTDARGEVEFTLSPVQQKTAASIVIQPLPEGPLSCVMRTLDSDQTIQVEAHGSEVRLIDRQWIGHAGRRNWLVSSSGCAVPFLAKVEDESPGRQAMVFRRLARGTWTYVQTSNVAELAAVLTGRGLTLPPIRRFVVEPGSVTNVHLSKP